MIIYIFIYFIFLFSFAESRSQNEYFYLVFLIKSFFLEFWNLKRGGPKKVFLFRTFLLKFRILRFQVNSELV